MPSNFTANYNLSQWERSDQVKMEDFNADNAKIDGALAGKAEQSALNALSQTVSGHTATLNKKGNCQIYFSTYTGTGSYGQSGPTSYTFPGKPLFVMVGTLSNELMIMFFQGVKLGAYFRNADQYGVPVSWSGNTISWYAGSDFQQLNMKGVHYNIMALIAADA